MKILFERTWQTSVHFPLPKLAVQVRPVAGITSLGDVRACAAILPIVVIAGGPLLFARAWNCNHQQTGPVPCDIRADRIIVLAVLLAAVALSELTKWAFDRRVRLIDDEEQ